MKLLLTLLIRVLLVLALFWLIRRLAWLCGTLWGRRSSGRSSKEPFIAGELKKDPVCGAYVATDISFKTLLDNEELHFCSLECRQKYLGARHAQ